MTDPVAVSEALPPGTPEEEPTVKCSYEALEWVLNRAEEIVAYEHGKVAAYSFTQAWLELPDDLHPSAPVLQPGLRELAMRLQRKVHEDAVNANAMFSVEHWKHNAGPEWPHMPDDDSYLFFENCKHPDCVLVLAAPDPRGEPPRKNRFDCTTCGQGIAVDEDGCCRSCGADATVVQEPSV